MPLPFANRAEAGWDLGRRLADFAWDRPLVLGVPRGGVAVAAPVAKLLDADLDVVVVRKLGAPNNAELGIGAVGPWGEPWVDERIVALLGVSDDFLAKEVEAQQRESRRRVEAYRGTRPLDVAGRDVLVVDDGIATGGTVIAAANLLRSQSPRRLVLAVPVAPSEGVGRARTAYDEVVALHTPQPYYAVGQWYRDFHQVSDDEVAQLLAAPSVDR